MRSAGLGKDKLIDERILKEMGLKRNKLHGWKYEIVNESLFIIACLKYEFIFHEIDELEYSE